MGTMTSRTGNFAGYLRDKLNARENAKLFAVKSVNKGGSLSKSADFERFTTREEAETAAARRASLNPGRSYRVVDL